MKTTPLNRKTVALDIRRVECEVLYEYVPRTPATHTHPAEPAEVTIHAVLAEVEVYNSARRVTQTVNLLDWLSHNEIERLTLDIICDEAYA